MRLRCSQDIRSEREPHVPLEIGAEYDVAEILECLGTVMIRRLGDTHWPTPDHSWFCRDPRCFAPLEAPVEILSSGYEHYGPAHDSFGVVFHDIASVERLRWVSAALDGLPDYPDPEEPYDDWRWRVYQVSSGLPEGMSRLIHELWTVRMRDSGEATTPSEPHIAVMDNVWFPSEYQPSVAIVAYNVGHMVRWNLSMSAARALILRFLSAAGVDSASEIGILQADFWHGVWTPRLLW